MMPIVLDRAPSYDWLAFGLNPALVELSDRDDSLAHAVPAAVLLFEQEFRDALIFCLERPVDLSVHQVPR